MISSCELPVFAETEMQFNRRGIAVHAEPTAVLKTLSDPTRRAIFERLSMGGEMTVHALTDPSGVSQPAISKHLGALKLAGLVRGRRDGRETYYSVEPKALAPLIDWISFYSTFWNNRFDRLETLLKRMDQ
jgi:DNA-binding transcriptional ArsR family regulator